MRSTIILELCFCLYYLWKICVKIDSPNKGMLFQWCHFCNLNTNNSRNTVIQQLCRLNPFNEYYRFNEMVTATPTPKPYLARVGEKTAYKCYRAAVARYFQSDNNYDNRKPFSNRVILTLALSKVLNGSAFANGLTLGP